MTDTSYEGQKRGVTMMKGASPDASGLSCYLDGGEEEEGTHSVRRFLIKEKQNFITLPHNEVTLQIKGAWPYHSTMWMSG